jgi:hypothetical protein
LEALAIAAVTAGTGTGVSAQCRVAASKPCEIVLRGEGAPAATPSCAEGAWKHHLSFELPEKFADADGDGWHEVVFELDLDPARGCGCAVFRITIDGAPTGHFVNIGDSPTNDGYGGDADSTRFDAELMLYGGRRLAVFGSDRHGEPVGSQQILGLDSLELADATVELEVCDQSVRFAVEPPGDSDGIDGILTAATTGDLMAIRRPTSTAKDSAGEIGADAKIHAAFNRVIHRRAGRPAQKRFGTGVRRVEISLTP